MKNKLILSAFSMAVFLSILNLNYLIEDKLSVKEILLRKNIEALAQENNNTYTRYYKPGKKTKNQTIIIQSTAGAFAYSKSYEIDCCVSATYMEGCDFSYDDPEC